MRTIAIALTFALAAGAGCTSRPEDPTGASTMTRTDVTETKAAARRFYDTLTAALRTGELDALDGVVHPDAVDHDPDMKPGGAAIKEAFRGLRAAFPDARFVIEDMVAEGDKVAVRVTTHATHRGEFLGVAPTGREIQYTVVDILRFADGKLVERWGLFDHMNVMRQLQQQPSS